jgi:hypothetical protein
MEMFVAHMPMEKSSETKSLLDRAKTMAKRMVPQPFSPIAALATVDDPPQGSALLNTPDVAALAAVSSRQSRALQVRHMHFFLHDCDSIIPCRRRALLQGKVVGLVYG